MAEQHVETNKKKQAMAISNKSESESEEMSRKKAYFASLSEWSKQSNNWLMFSYYGLSYAFCKSNRLMKREAQLIAEANVRELRSLQTELKLVRMLDGEQRLEIVHEWGGIDMLVAPFWKRIVAEFIDTLNIFILKTIMAFFIVQMYSNLIFPKPTVPKSMDKEKVFEVSLDFINPKYDSLMQLLLTKLLVCTYEFLWITFNKGSTPGKYLMNLRVLYVDTIIPLEPHLERFQLESTAFWALIYPAITPDASRTFMRVFAKHLVITCFFPVCFLLIFPRSNRTTYDLVTRTLVVEMNTERFPTQPRF